MAATETPCVDVTPRGEILNSWTCRDCHRIRVYFNIDIYAPELDDLDNTYSIYIKLSVQVQFDKWAHAALRPIYLGDNEYRFPFSPLKDFTDGYVDFTAEFRPLGNIQPEIVKIRTCQCSNPADLSPVQWELTNPDNLVTDCYLSCKSGFEGDSGEGSCDNHCGDGGYCCNGASTSAPYNICSGAQMEPLRQQSIIHHVCVKPVEGTAPVVENLACVPDGCGPNQIYVNGECKCEAGFSPSEGTFYIFATLQYRLHPKKCFFHFFQQRKNKEINTD